MKLTTGVLAALLVAAGSTAAMAECARDGVLTAGYADGINSLFPSRAIVTPCSTLFNGSKTDAKRLRGYDFRPSENSRYDVPDGLIDGRSAVAARFAPPASTAPQPGLYSVEHNMER